MPDNLTFEQPMTFNKEVVIPNFDTTDDMNDYTPARAGALAQVGTDTYKYDGSQWVKFSDTENTGGSTYRGSIDDL
jgi:hypothetical protein